MVDPHSSPANLSRASSERTSRQVVLYGLAATLVASVVYVASFEFFRAQELSTARGRLSLYHSTTVAELERFTHLSFVLSRDPYVLATASGGNPAQLDARLAGFAERAGLDAIYLMGSDGVTISASNAGSASSFVGQDYSFRPYFQDAVSGGNGRFYGIGATTGLPGYFIADPVRDGAGNVIGVIAIKLDLTRLEARWRAAGETVFLVNRDGVVLLASNADWRYRASLPLSAAQRAEIATSRQFIGQPLTPLDWQPQGETSAAIDGQVQIHLTRTDLLHDWALHYFASNAPAATRSWLAAGLAVMFGAALLILFQLRRNARIAALLRGSEAEQAQLRDSNRRLAIEIDERRAAERRLHRAQSELARTSRLAALGELSASVTHELGQPITAMRNHLAAAEMTGQGGLPVAGKLAGLVDRMEGITRQLKFFSSPGEQALTPVDLRAAMDEALTLVAPNIDAQNVQLRKAFPNTPVVVHGNPLRIEQVMTNLLRNAIDAMEDSDPPSLEVVLGSDTAPGGGEAWFEIRDRGHGLGAGTLEEWQEPFATSRASGQGMGLGLAISAGIVKEHGGQMQARDRSGGGTVFRVELPLHPAQNEDAR